jgi:hypothetical protein
MNHLSNCAVRRGAPDLCTCGAIADFAHRVEALQTLPAPVWDWDEHSELEAKPHDQLFNILERVCF